MTEKELTNLLTELSAAGLGQLPRELSEKIENNIDFLIIDDTLIRQEEVEEPVKEPKKKDPLFGSW